MVYSVLPTWFFSIGFYRDCFFLFDDSHGEFMGINSRGDVDGNRLVDESHQTWHLEIINTGFNMV